MILLSVLNSIQIVSESEAIPVFTSLHTAYLLLAAEFILYITTVYHNRFFHY